MFRIDDKPVNMSREIADTIKSGTKLIFINNGGVLSANVNYIYTFDNWYKKSPTVWWQSKELKEYENNYDHNFHIGDCEIYNPEIHKNGIIVTKELLLMGLNNWLKRFGDGGIEDEVREIKDNLINREES